MRNSMISCVLLATATGCAIDPQADTSLEKVSAQTLAIPAELDAIEGAAEHVVDSALVGDPAAVAAGLAEIQAAWDVYRTYAAADGAPKSARRALEEAIEELEGSVEEGDTNTKLARVANAISAPMPRLFAVYHPQIPPIVLELDYLGRELLFDALETTASKGKRHLTRIKTTWNAFRPTVVMAGGATEAGNVDAALTAASAALAAHDFTALEAAALAELEHVDAIEHVFAP
jgi:hypothetical protein